MILKKEQAELALKMCDILDAKPEGYKKMQKELKAELSRLNNAPAPDIDLQTFCDLEAQ